MESLNVQNQDMQSQYNALKIKMKELLNKLQGLKLIKKVYLLKRGNY